MGRHRQRPQRHRPHHAHGRQRASRCASAGRCSDFNARGLHGAQGRAANSIRSCPFGVAAGYAGHQGFRRRGQRRLTARASAWPWAPASAASPPSRTTRRKWLETKHAAQDFAVLHPRQHHQRGCRAGVDPSRPARTEHRAGHRLHDVDALDRPGLSPDPVRRCRHHGGGWLRDGVHPAGRRQLLPGACAVAAQRRARARQPPVGPGPRRLRHGRRRRRHRA